MFKARNHPHRAGTLCTAWLALALFLVPLAAEARPSEVARALPGAERVGAARYEVLTLHVFDAELWSQRSTFAWGTPFALTLTYRRNFSARSLIGRSATEMRRRGVSAQNVEAITSRLQSCFADVAPGDRITGVSTGDDSARFYFNGIQRCQVSWPGFDQAFFGIWLDARGSQAEESARLRGQA